LKGGWHFLSGGIAAIEDIGIADESFQIFAGDFALQRMKQDSELSSEMIQLQPGSEFDAFYHYIVSPTI
jgi:hypothetical protein